MNAPHGCPLPEIGDPRRPFCAETSVTDHMATRRLRWPPTTKGPRPWVGGLRSARRGRSVGTITARALGEGSHELQAPGDRVVDVATEGEREVLFPEAHRRADGVLLTRLGEGVDGGVRAGRIEVLWCLSWCNSMILPEMCGSSAL